MQVRCWGARGTVPSPGPHTLRYGGHTSCIELAPASGERIVFDAGSGIRALGQAMQRDETPCTTPVQLFLTHRHFDHVIGLPHFLPLVSQHAPMVLRCGNASVADVHELVNTLLAPPLFVSVPSVDDALRVEPCESGAPIPVGSGWQIHRFNARHNGGAAVFRVDDGARPVLAFAPDNELSYASTDETVVQWRQELTGQLHRVPVLIHDAMFVNSELDRFAGWGHSSAEEATRLAIECEAGKLVLFHHHPDRTDNQIDSLVMTCRAIAREHNSNLQIAAAYEGMTIAL